MTHDTGCKRLLKVPAHWLVGYSFSGPGDCYRESLTHVWGNREGKLRLLLYLMMNPSAAGTEPYVTDSTVAKCARIAKRLGFDGIIVVNACAYRVTQSKELLKVTDPVGPRNHISILEMARRADKIIVAHGKLPGKLQVHADAAVKLLRDAGHDLYALDFTKDGIPRHPLYIKDGCDPVPFPDTERIVA